MSFPLSLHFVYLYSECVSDCQVSERGVIYLFSPVTCSFVAYRATRSTVGVKWPKSGKRWDVQQLGEEKDWECVRHQEVCYRMKEKRKNKKAQKCHTHRPTWRVKWKVNFLFYAAINKPWSLSYFIGEVGKHTKKEKHMWFVQYFLYFSCCISPFWLFAVSGLHCWIPAGEQGIPLWTVKEACWFCIWNYSVQEITEGKPWISHSGSPKCSQVKSCQYQHHFLSNVYLFCAGERRKVPIMKEGVSVLGNGWLLSCHDL